MKKIKGYIPFALLLSLLSTLIVFSAYGQWGDGHIGGKGGMGRGTGGESRQSYDPYQTTVISGDVLTLKDIETKSGNMSGAGLELSSDGNIVLVFLGPHIYVDLQNFRINVGDHVSITGVMALVEGQSIFIACEIRKGDEVLKLRNDKGVPLWAGTRQQHSR